MIATSTILACVATLFVSLVLPILVLLVLSLKNRKQGIVSAWLLGAAGFLVTQIGIRLPILNALQGQSWFLEFSQNHLFLYAFSLAFTAGLFELAGRFAVAKLLPKKLTYKRSLAAGLGHGGIEAIVLIGMAYISNLTYILMIQSGTFDAMLSQVPADQAVYLESIRTSLLTTPSAMFLLAGFERLLAMIAHTAMSMLVCWGVHTGEPAKCVLICLGLHTLIDLTAGISLLIGTKLTQTAAYTIIYTMLIIVAGLSVWILKSIRSRWQEQEVSHVS